MSRRSMSALGLFLLSAILTAAGFFVATVPLIVAYLPFGAAILVKSPSLKIGCVSGHFVWVALVSAWGLSALGYDALYSLLAALASGVVLSVFMAFGTVGFASLLLCLVGWFPANPLLVTGAIYPGMGMIGLLLLSVFAGLIELRRKKKLPFVLLAFFFASSVMANTLHLVVTSPDQDVSQSAQVSAFHPIELSSEGYLTRSGEWRMLEAHIPQNSTVVLGENIFGYDDGAGKNHWCRVSERKSAELFIGVEGRGGVSEIWRFDRANCPEPVRIYSAHVAIPGITGPVGMGLSNWSDLLTSSDPVQWIACFEGFSVARWFGVSRADPQVAIVVSNDELTAPFPTSQMRKKVASLFGRLFDIEIVHAGKGTSMLVSAARSISL
jgi:hypothetical protein